MNSSNFMYARTMFLLSDTFNQSPPVLNRPIPSSSKRQHFINVCEKGCQCEGPNALFCGSSNNLLTSLPENKSVNPKLILPSYPPVPPSAENDYAIRKDGPLLSASVNTAPPNPAQRVQCSDERQAHQNSVIRTLSIEKSPKDRPYICEDCGKTFLLKHHLVTHARVHSGERPHICVHCGKSFAHKHCLSTHLLLHTSDRPYTCPECNKSFTLKHHLVTHARVHSRERPFVCTQCGQSFPQKRHLVTHVKFHSGERPFVCPDCGESFAQEDHLVMHSRFHGGQHPFQCHDCGLSFARKFELVNHERIHGRIPHACAVCGKEFLQKRTLQAHTRLHLAAIGSEHPYSCVHCGEAFTGKAALAAHSCGDKEKNFTCRECGNGFSSREGLSLHLRLHAGDRSFVPDLCSLAAAFQQHSGLLNPALGSPGPGASPHPHQSSGVGRPPSATHQQENNSVPVSLHGSARITGQPNAAASESSSHGAKIKPHICQDCGRAFSKKHGLIQHNKRYINGGCEIRRFACDQCGKAFLQKNHLVLHERQHLGSQERNGCVEPRSQVPSVIVPPDIRSLQSGVSSEPQHNLQESIHPQRDSSPVHPIPVKSESTHVLEDQTQHYPDYCPSASVPPAITVADHENFTSCPSV